MKILSQALLLCIVVGSAPMIGCQKNSNPEVGAHAYTKKLTCREFSTSTAPETHCLVPYVALIANAHDYDGMRIYTYAYLQTTGHGIYGLSIEKGFRAQPDFASCIALDPIDVKLPDTGTYVYSVAIAGLFEFTPKGHCLGIIRNPVVDSMQLESSDAS